MKSPAAEERRLAIGLVIDCVPLGQHPFMQDTGDQNAVLLLSVEQDALAMLVPTQAGADMTARPPEPWIVGEHLATCLKLVEVTGSLGFAPFTNGELGNTE
jgi:hypothetical protein